MPHNKETKAIILAAGKGTRMKSEKAKVLHEIFDTTLLGYVLNALNATKLISSSVVVVGHRAEDVENFVKNNYDNASTVLQAEQKGTGHAVSMACAELENFEGNVMILCGDTPLLRPETLKAFWRAHCDNLSDITVMSANFDDPTGYGRIVRNIDGTLRAIVEEKDADYQQKNIQEVNAGVYCLNWKKVKHVFSQLKNNNSQGEYYLTDIAAWGAKEKHINATVFTLKDNSEILGVNSKIDLAEAAKILNQRHLTKLMQDGVTIIDPPTARISPDVEIGVDTTIYPGVYIHGKVKIGKNCKIGPFAHIRGDVEIGNNVRIGNFVEVKSSVIKDNTNVSHLSYIGDSEVGSGVNIGAGTITANYNPVTKEKSKTIIGDNANTGSNSVLVAPIEVEESAFIAAGTVVSKDVKARALAIARAPLKIIENWVKGGTDVK